MGVNGSPLCWTNKRHNWPLLKAQPPLFPLSFRKRPLSVDAAALMGLYNKTGQWQIDKISNCLSTNQSLEVSRRRGNPNSVSLALTGVLFREYAQNYTTLIWRPKIWAGVKHAPDLTQKETTHSLTRDFATGPWWFWTWGSSFRLWTWKLRYYIYIIHIVHHRLVLRFWDRSLIPNLSPVWNVYIYIHIYVSLVIGTPEVGYSKSEC